MSKNNKTTRKEQFIENRKTLIALSLIMRQLVEAGEADSVNEALKDSYIEENADITEFKTFAQWKQDGCTIKKGSKAFLIWGQPRKIEQVPEGSDEPQEFKYWPICYLFANTQVVSKQDKQPKPSPEPRQEHKQLADPIYLDSMLV